jgi:hypothetical protein
MAPSRVMFWVIARVRMGVRPSGRPELIGSAGDRPQRLRRLGDRRRGQRVTLLRRGLEEREREQGVADLGGDDARVVAREAAAPCRTPRIRNPIREWIGAQIRTDLYG